MLNVSLISINSKYIHSSLAVWCLKSGVENFSETKINMHIKEFTINESKEGIIKDILKDKPDVIAFSCYIWNINTVKYVSSEIKKQYNNVKIIFGGPEVSYNQQEVINNTSVDYIISGEGEKSFAELLDCINLGKGYERINGLSYKIDGKYMENPFEEPDFSPLDPYCEEYFDKLGNRIVYLETSRGCPYRCAFCLSGRCGKLKFFDISQVKKNILKLANSGTKTVKFVDRTFNANSKRANEILKFIIENYKKKIPEGVCFHFEIAGDILTDETIEILNSAPLGLFQLEIGLQSFNEKTLSYINRKTNTKRLIENIKKLVAPRNIHIHIDLIAGLPYEDLESFKNSFNIAFYLYPNMLQLGFLKILHGADMRVYREKYACEFSNDPPYEVISTPYITNEELNTLHFVEDSLERLYNSGRFIEVLKYIFEETKIKPFDFFYMAGKFFSQYNLYKISLDEYTNLFYSFIQKNFSLDKTIIRDKMLIDRLSTVAGGIIPQSLKISDPYLKRIRLYLDRSLLTRRDKNVQRGLGILYSENKFVYCDYIDINPVLKRYELVYCDFDKDEIDSIF